MTSIGDVANEMKAILEDVRTNTLGTRNNTSQLVTEVNHLDNTDQAGFANLAAGLSVIIQLEQQGNALSAVNNAQNDTIICWLGKIAHVLCDIKHDLDASLAVQQQMSNRLAHMSAVFDLTYAKESIEVSARERLQAEIDSCCGDHPKPPTPCFEDCPKPENPPYHPVPVEWKPIVFEPQQPPVK